MRCRHQQLRLACLVVYDWKRVGIDWKRVRIAHGSTATKSMACSDESVCLRDASLALQQHAWLQRRSVSGMSGIR